MFSTLLSESLANPEEYVDASGSRTTQKDESKERSHKLNGSSASVYSKHRPKSHHGRGSIGSLSISSLSFLPRVSSDVSGHAVRDRSKERVILFDRIVFFSFIVCILLFFYALSGSGVSSKTGQPVTQDGTHRFSAPHEGIESHVDHLGVGVDPEGQFTFSHGIGRVVPTLVVTAEKRIETLM